KAEKPWGNLLFYFAPQHLTDSSHGVRNKCLLLIGCLGTVEKAGGSKEVDRQSPKDVQKIIGDHFSDQDPRVRSAAIKAMLQLHERGLKLQQAIYNQVMIIIVPIPSSNEEIRLVDDAFGKICHMVSDGSWVVRVQAAKLLVRRFLLLFPLPWCLKFLGGRHPTLVLPLVPELLGTHPFFDTPEPDMDDPACILSSPHTCSAVNAAEEFRFSTDIAVLVLIFNAAKSCPTMPALFSDHTFRHYAYLRDSLSHLVPPLRGLLYMFIPFLWPRDLQRFGELQSDLAGMADFSAAYLRCQLLLIKTFKTQSLLVQIMEETYKMEFMYSNVEHRQVVIIHHMRLQAKALQLIVTVRTTRGCFISELPHMQGSFVDKLLDLMPRLVTSKPSEVVKILRVTLRQSNFLRLPLPEKIMYPDGQSQVIHPKPADFRNPGPGRHRLITQVYLSHTAWTEPCQIELRLLLAYSSDRTKASVGVSRSTWGDSTDLLPPSEGSIEGTLLFGKPVKVYIMPKPARR
ncbi:Integrator complex subunit 4, partial [Ophiophagus hannah]